MKTASDTVLLRLEWQVLRRLEGRLQGGYRTVHRGSGTDFAGLRPYSDGDDARFIDWNVTARLDELQIRQFNEDRELTAWLVLDRSASMSVGGPDRGKGDVLAELALSLARLLGRGGNRVGAVLYAPGATRIVPPGTGRRQALLIGGELDRSVDGGGGGGSTTDLGAMLETVASLARRRSLVVVVSDFIGTGEWAKPLLRLAHRNEVVAVRIVDAADDVLPSVGLIVVEDVETGEQLLVDSSDPLFRSRFSSGVEERDELLADGMRHARVPLHRVGTEDALLDSLLSIVRATRRRPA